MMCKIRSIYEFIFHNWYFILISFQGLDKPKRFSCQKWQVLGKEED